MYVLIFAVGSDNSFWASYSFILEHGLVISLLLFLKNKCESVTSIVILWGEILRRIELIVFNIILIPLPVEQYKEAKHTNSIVLLVLGTIFIITVLVGYLIWGDKLKCLIKKL